MRTVQQFHDHKIPKSEKCQIPMSPFSSFSNNRRSDILTFNITWVDAILFTYRLVVLNRQTKFHSVPFWSFLFFSWTPRGDFQLKKLSYLSFQCNMNYKGRVHYFHIMFCFFERKPICSSKKQNILLTDMVVGVFFPSLHYLQHSQMCLWGEGNNWSDPISQEVECCYRWGHEAGTQGGWRSESCLKTFYTKFEILSTSTWLRFL